MYKHTLVIGGTGMLRDASVQLAVQSQRLTSVAHTQRSLAALDATLPPGSGRHEMLALDWTAPETVLRALEAHVRLAGPPDLVVAWIHSGSVKGYSWERLGDDYRCRKGR